MSNEERDREPMTPTEREHDSVAVDLFKHADEKIEKTRQEVVNLKEVELTIKDMMKHLTNRVDFGVSKTAQEAKETLAQHSIVLNDIGHRLENQDKKIDNVAISLGKSIDSLRDMVKSLYKYILAVFFTLVAAGLITLGAKAIGKILGLF